MDGWRAMKPVAASVRLFLCRSRLFDFVSEGLSTYIFRKALCSPALLTSPETVASSFPSRSDIDPFLILLTLSVHTSLLCDKKSIIQSNYATIMRRVRYEVIMENAGSPENKDAQTMIS